MTGLNSKRQFRIGTLVGTALIIWPFAASAKTESELLVERLTAESKTWKPQDNVTSNFLGNDKSYAGVRQYAIDFFELPPGYSAEASPGGYEFSIFKGTGTTHQRVALQSLAPLKTLRFQHRIEVTQGGTKSSRLLVCTLPLAGFTPRDEDVALVRFMTGGGWTYPWVDESAEIGDFCGLLSLRGEVIYRLPVDQKKPDSLVRPIGISPDGNTAIFALGSALESMDGELDVGNYREIFVWRYPDLLERFKPELAEGGVDFDAIRREAFNKSK